MNRINKGIVCAVLVVLLCGLFGGCHEVRDDALEVHMLDVGNADCFLVKQGNKALLVDGGEIDDIDHVMSYLNSHGVEELEAIIISHMHSDHIGSLTRVIEHYQTNTVYYAAVPEGVEEMTLLHRRLYDMIEKRGVTLCEASNGEIFSLGRAQVEIYPLSVQSDDGNDYSLFARVSYGSEAILFTGDATEKGQRALIRSGLDIEASVIKLSHHGAKIDSTRELLDAVKPKRALLSCLAENIYGHPHDDTMLALKERGILCHRTDANGYIVMTITEEGEYFIETSR